MLHVFLSLHNSGSSDSDGSGAGQDLGMIFQLWQVR
jgi:hypothetical protein